MTAKEADWAAKLHLPVILKDESQFGTVKCRRIVEVTKVYCENLMRPEIVILCAGSVGNAVYRATPAMATLDAKQALLNGMERNLEIFSDMKGEAG